MMNCIYRNERPSFNKLAPIEVEVRIIELEYVKFDKLLIYGYTQT